MHGVYTKDTTGASPCRTMRKNWIYITLLCLIIALNVLPRLGKQEAKEAFKSESAQEAPDTFFMGFTEAQEKSKKIENAAKKNFPLYLFYIFVNTLIVFMLLAGIAVDGYLISGWLRKKPFFQKTQNPELPRWKIAEVFKIIILAFAASYIFLLLLTFFAGAFQAATGTKIEFYKNEHFRMVFDTIVLDFIFFLVILRFLWAGHRKKLADIGFAVKNLAKNIFYGVSGYAGVIPVIFTIGALVYAALNFFKIIPPPQPIVGLFLAEKNIVIILASSLIAAVFGPVIEEIFFRGVMYNAVKRRLGVFRAILITGVLFSFLHTHAFEYFLVGFIPITILGMALAYLYEKTGSLIPSITLHILNNTGSVCMVFLFKYFNSLAG